MFVETVVIMFCPIYAKWKNQEFLEEYLHNVDIDIQF